jgi:hypothetical protein
VSARHIDEAAYGPDHPEVARVLSNLALTLRDPRKPAGARPLQERAQVIGEAAQSAWSGSLAGSGGTAFQEGTAQPRIQTV